MNARLMYFCLLLFGASACRSTDVPSLSYESIITEEISVPVREDVRLPKIAFTPDVSALKPAGDTSPIRIVAYGGSYFAGFRNGGLFREGQLTSIPELIAHQMQLQTFESPLFQTEHGNGSGYYFFDKQASLPSWKKVTNQTAVISASPLQLLPFNGKRIDNIACPEGPVATADSSLFFFRYPKQKQYFAYLHRFFGKSGTEDNPFDFFADSLGAKTHVVLRFDDMDLWVGMALYSKQLRIEEILHSGYFTAKRIFIENNLEKGRKLVLYNIPDFLDFPFFHLFDVKKLSDGDIKRQTLTDSSLLIPNDRVKTLFAAKQNVLLQEEDILSESEVVGFRYTVQNILNKNATEAFAEQYNLPMVDLHALFKQVLRGDYRTEEGFFINPSFPSGNFFSDDGIHLTPIGNAVLANETIKTINKFYKTRIPLIDIEELSKVVK
ncbi:hypothetical protein [Dyadobacter fermentans]|uniref:Lipolytic protein G-D-S-L family n=1 Tax=Dyadobacter fermentans (strain ATCC 700827 / DSM 18053 / CIP 107007 / KCTC 52180 / NS114) TaxID=471854 RepID=C6W3A1_DYAFD|nr:hypothetical protein [Dyadobacter fermentans]ACT92205.1 hypothetical protein Dfer_0953 [Dyadobacter fermentans DSM 18053]